MSTAAYLDPHMFRGNDAQVDAQVNVRIGCAKILGVKL